MRNRPRCHEAPADGQSATRYAMPAADVCEFCNSPGGPVLWQNDLCRVVRVDEPDYPGYVRVILGRHSTEMADLGRDERDRFMAVVFAVEAAVRDTMKAD